jgi:tryptophan synthase alpha chain
MNRIDRMFQSKRQQNEPAMIFYLTAGYPDLATTEKVIAVLAEEGADLIELGIPFSDPIADGPTIQYASQVALERGVTVQGILEMAGRVRRRHPELAMIFFSAYNPIFHRGEAAFVSEAAAAGVDGLLIPDLPPEEAGELRAAAAQAGLCMVFLIAPTTTPARGAMIAGASTGFIYYISLKGVTGARTSLPPDLGEKVRAIKAMTAKPVAVGFGVSQPDQAREIGSFADGVVVGSALIKAIGSDSADPGLLDRVREFARSMVGGKAEMKNVRQKKIGIRNSE